MGGGEGGLSFFRGTGGLLRDRKGARAVGRGLMTGACITATPCLLFSATGTICLNILDVFFLDFKESINISDNIERATNDY